MVDLNSEIEAENLAVETIEEDVVVVFEVEVVTVVAEISVIPVRFRHHGELLMKSFLV